MGILRGSGNNANLDVGTPAKRWQGNKKEKKRLKKKKQHFYTIVQEKPSGTVVDSYPMAVIEKQ